MYELDSIRIQETIQIEKLKNRNLLLLSLILSLSQEKIVLVQNPIYTLCIGLFMQTVEINDYRVTLKTKFLVRNKSKENPNIKCTNHFHKKGKRENSLEKHTKSKQYLDSKIKIMWFLHVSWKLYFSKLWERCMASEI